MSNLLDVERTLAGEHHSFGAAHVANRTHAPTRPSLAQLASQQADWAGDNPPKSGSNTGKIGLGRARGAGCLIYTHGAA